MLPVSVNQVDVLLWNRSKVFLKQVCVDKSKEDQTKLLGSTKTVVCKKIFYL